MRRVPEDYRTILGQNIARLMKAKGLTSKTIKATYVDGPKKGQEVSERSIRNIVNGKGNGPSIDMVAAIAAKLDVSVWQLLTPIHDANHLPALALSADERKLHEDFQRWRKRFNLPDNNDGTPDGATA